MPLRNSKMKILLFRDVLSSIICGVNYQKYQELQVSRGEAYINKKSYNTYFDDIANITTEYTDNILKKQLNDYITSNKTIDVITDTRWSSQGFTANEASTLVFDLETKKIIARYHSVKSRYHSSESRKFTTTTDTNEILYEAQREEKDMKHGANFLGPSGRMEGYGITLCFKHLKDTGIKISKLIHDDDAKVYDLVSEFYPDIENHLDFGHACKNAMKRIRSVCKSYNLSKNHSEYIARYIYMYC